MLGATPFNAMRGGHRAGAILALLLTASTATGAAAKPLSPAPSIASISPASGARGTTVTISGRDFGGPQARITVGGVAAPLLSASGNRATFRVPPAAPFGPTLVRVANPSGQSDVAPFTVVFGGTLTPLPATSGAVTQTIGRAGGTLRSGGLQLAIPPGALSSDVSITMRPLQGVSGTPFDASFIGGVQLLPEGLAFLVPAVLTIPVPATVRPADILAFGSSGTGANVHLQPYALSGGMLTRSVWHFSIESAAAAGADGAAAMASVAPTSAEAAALQAIAIADAACAQEQVAGIHGGPACLGQPEAHVQALRAWHLGSVQPGLHAAIGAPYATAELALLDWMWWGGQVQASGVGDALLAEQFADEEAAVAVLADQVRTHLDRCTGADLTEELRAVARLADMARATAITQSLGEGLPSAADGSLLAACASIEIDELDLPDPAARGTDRNTLEGRASLGFWNGPNRTDMPLTLEVKVNGDDTSAPTLGNDGRFRMPLWLPEDGQSVQVQVTATSASPLLVGLGLEHGTATMIRSLRDRLEVNPAGLTLAGGAHADVFARLAGDDVAGRTIAFALSGQGSLSAATASTNASGSTSVTFTAGTSSGTTELTASFVDGTVTRTKSITIAVGDAVTVAISPAAVLVDPDAQVPFSATITGATDPAVTWSATCGSITSSGLYTAPAGEATCSVTATSVEALGATATAIVTVVDDDPEDPPAGIAVSIAPDDVMLARGASQQFVATVTGTTDTAVTWTARCGSTLMPIGSNGLFSVPVDLAEAAASCSVVATSVADTTVSATALAHVGWIEVVSVLSDMCADASDSFVSGPDPGTCMSGLAGDQMATIGGATASTSMDASMDLSAGQLIVDGSIASMGSAAAAQVFDEDGNGIGDRQCSAQSSATVYLTFRVVGDRVPWALDFDGQVGVDVAAGSGHSIAFARLTRAGLVGVIVGTTNDGQEYPNGVGPISQRTVGGDPGSDAPDVAFADHGWMSGGVYVIQLYAAAEVWVTLGNEGSAASDASLGFVVGPYAP